jgi:hypothetical protein
VNRTARKKAEVWPIAYAAAGIPSICDRCKQRLAAFIVRSDVLDLKVCAVCAEEAKRLGLEVIPLEEE